MVHWIWLHDRMDNGPGNRHTARLPTVHHVLHHVDEVVWSEVYEGQDDVTKKEAVGLRGFVRRIRIRPRLAPRPSHSHHPGNFHLLARAPTTSARRLFQPHDYLLDWQNFPPPLQLNAAKLRWENYLLYDILAEADVPVPLRGRPVPAGE